MGMSSKIIEDLEQAERGHYQQQVYYRREAEGNGCNKKAEKCNKTETTETHDGPNTIEDITGSLDMITISVSFKIWKRGIPRPIVDFQVVYM